MSKFKTVILTSSLTLLVASIIFAYFYFKGKQDQVPLQEYDNTFITPDTVISPPEEREEINTEIYASRQNILTKTVSEVSSAVVGINVTAIREYRDPFSMDPLFRYFFGDRVYQQQVKGLGSGTIISPDGYILTNDHVAGNAVDIIVTMTDGTQYSAEIVGTDQSTDICLLKINADNLPYIKFGDSETILIGEWVIALGNPFGLFDINDKPTVTVGVISAAGMNLNQVNNRFYTNMIQTDAAINGGNSGGPLVNSVGELIAMNTLIYTTQGSSGNVGVGFAIPVNKVKRIVNILKKNGSVDRNYWTGLQIQTIDQNIADYFNLRSTRGVIITNIQKNSPAERAGLLVRDIILEAGRFRINNDVTLISVLHEYQTGETISLKIFRDNQILVKKLKLERIND
ncbi:S1C family serine protease [Bacteroidota bacterium]